jgi:hypothetical protein
MDIVFEALVRTLFAPIEFAIWWSRESRRRRVAVAKARAQLRIEDADSVAALLAAVHGLPQPGDLERDMGRCLSRELSATAIVDPEDVTRRIDECFSKLTFDDVVIRRLGARRVRFAAQILAEAHAAAKPAGGRIEHNARR